MNTQPNTPIVPIKEINNLVYYRCRDCLSTFTSEHSPTMCACSGGLLEILGRVTFDKRRYEKLERVSVCDARCTNASGPLCNCKCNCKNHGTGKVREVVTLGGFVRIKDIDDAALNRSAEFNALIKDVTAEILTLQNHTYGRRSRFYEYKLKELRALKVHKTRIVRLTQLLNDVKTAIVEADQLRTLKEEIPF